MKVDGRARPCRTLDVTAARGGLRAETELELA